MKVTIKAVAAADNKVWAEAVVPMERDTRFNALRLDGLNASPQMKKAAKFLNANAIDHVVLNVPTEEDLDDDSPLYGGAIILLYGTKQAIKKLGKDESDKEIVFLRKGDAKLGGLNIKGQYKTDVFVSAVSAPKASPSNVIIEANGVTLQFSKKKSAEAKPVMAFMEDPFFDWSTTDIV